MATLYLSNRTSGKGSRLKINGVNITGKVSEFRTLVAKEIGVPQYEIELLYSGHCMVDEKALDFYGARPGCTIHALRKQDSAMHMDIPEKMDDSDVQQVVTALQAALLNPAYRSTVERMLTDQDTLENIVAATPGLAKDPIAVSMMQDPELLALLADPTTSQKVINAHPALGQAAMMVAAAVNEEGAKAGNTTTGGVSHSARGTYSLDQMSDDEDMEGSGGQMGAGFAASITPSLLAAAIAAAGGGGAAGLQQQSSQSSQPPSGSSMITSDFFRQAMAAAADASSSSTTTTNTTTTGTTQPATTTTTTSSSSPSTPDIPPHILQAQLDQLRDMGITDETAARNALQATSGNLEAAIALLFGDGGF